MRIAMMALALALATTGCKKKENKPADNAGSGSAMAGSDMGSGAGSDMAGSGSDMAGSDMAGSDMAGSGSAVTDVQMSKKAGNCPSTVLGATTKAEVKGKDLILTITSKDKDAVAAIQKRTEELLADKKGGAGSPASGHDQKGTHGGSTGLCPVHV